MLFRKNSALLLETAFGLLGGALLLFIIAPLFGLLLNSPAQNVVQTAHDAAFQKSVWLTLWTSMAATLIFALGAIPLSYLLAREKLPFSQTLSAIIDLPIVIPHSAAGIALLGFLSKGGLLGKTGLEFIGTPLGIIFAMAFVSVPFLVNSARDGFANVPEEFEFTAKNLGAGAFQTFIKVSLPMAFRPILSGMIMMWARGMSEFGAVVIVAYHPMTTPVMIYERLGAYGLNYARPVAAIFFIVCLILFIILRVVAKGNKDVY
jgi:molybdate/tungstate transport system permease protein